MPAKKEPKEVKPVKAKKEEAPKATLSLDDIQKLISASAPKPKAKRKTAEQTDEQKAKMLDRLALMRAKANENRALRSKSMTDELKTINTIEHGSSLEIKKLNEKDTDALFEKKYNSRFEKLDESVGEIKSHLSEMREAKKAKADAKAREAEEKKQNLEKVESKPSEPSEPVKYEPVHNKPIQSIQPTQPKPIIQPQGGGNGGTLVHSQPQVAKLPDYKKMFKRQF
jgi:hypothetical protein